MKSTGVGLLGLVFCIFLTLKLVDKIDWSWWWVTAPLWGPPAAVLAVFVLVAGLGLLFRKRIKAGAVKVTAKTLDKVEDNVESLMARIERLRSRRRYWND
jgi:hypothetical protein